MIRVKGLKPRVDVFTKKLHENMIKLWNDATRAFIAEIITNDLIAIDTGMSRSSLIPLGRAVKMVTAIRAFSPKQASRTGYTDIDGTYHPEIQRTGALGEKLGERAFTLNYGSPYRPVFKFEFRLMVYQYALHDSQWQSLERGQQAFTDYLKTHSKDYVPRLSEWILPETN